MVRACKAAYNLTDDRHDGIDEERFVLVEYGAAKFLLSRYKLRPSVRCQLAHATISLLTPASRTDTYPSNLADSYA